MLAVSFVVMVVKRVILESLGKCGCKVLKQLYLVCGKMIKENRLFYCIGPLE